ncbi:MAG: hypothetical protein OHK0017_09900 [Patescibacteria group bacterium]
MTSQELRRKFLDFMAEKGHKIVPSASLVPKEDPTVLFTTAGMQPMVPYLTGVAESPWGSKIADSQKCVRTVDIEEVGDNRHLTFFEMLGNWSIGDYFKAESIPWSFEFLTSPKWLGLDPERIYVTVFKGNKDVPADEESIKIWLEVFEKAGIKADVGVEYDFKNLDNPENKGKDFIYRITQRGAGDNWWGLPHRGPCGSDTEIFYLLDENPLDFRDSVLPNLSHKQVEDYLESQLVEIWNNVFMEYEGEWGEDGEPTKLVPLKSKNVDTGMGFERILAFLNKKETVFESDVLSGLVEVAEKYRTK